MYSEYETRQIHISIPRQHRMVENFLQTNGLRLDDVDYYAGIFKLGSDEMLAGGGLKGATIKCLAVSDEHRNEALACRMVSHLVSTALANGHQTVRLFTKPSNRAVFESMSFRLLAEAPQAIIMETGLGGIDTYCRYLSAQPKGNNTAGGSQEVGVIVMNANPFTLGHRYLIKKAAEQVEHLYVIAVKEEASLFGYDERLAMIRSGVGGISNVTVCEGSDYAVSSTTFPTYFLKRVTDASDTQMMLDIDLFRRHIAPALGATVRFVGSEPTDALTHRYNEMLKSMLPRVTEVERLMFSSTADSTASAHPMPLSATLVRAAIGQGSLAEVATMVPDTTLPYIIAHLATRALQMELDTTPKPGLVDRHDNGAHTDMDYQLMCHSIKALHPFFVRLAIMGFATVLPTYSELSAVGMEAERAMLAVTRGVNTHRGALFSMGLAVTSAAHTAYIHGASAIDATAIQHSIHHLASLFPDTNGTHGSEVKHRLMKDKAKGTMIKGALDNAREGYRQLFDDWLPYYTSLQRAADPSALHRTLLRIMCSLDDTNIIFRTDMDTAQAVKKEARQLLCRFSLCELQAMNTRFTAHNISPGGCADMLSLTVFVHSVCH